MILRICFISFVVSAIIAAACWLAPALAGEDVIKRDTNNDGKVDQVVHLDRSGKLSRVEIDSNADEVMDRFHYKEVTFQIIEELGLEVVGVEEVAPNLLPEPGLYASRLPSEADRADLSQVLALKVRSETGAMVPLSEVVAVVPTVREADLRPAEA